VPLPRQPASGGRGVWAISRVAAHRRLSAVVPIGRPAPVARDELPAMLLESPARVFSPVRRSLAPAKRLRKVLFPGRE